MLSPWAATSRDSSVTVEEPSRVHQLLESAREKQLSLGFTLLRPGNARDRILKDEFSWHPRETVQHAMEETVLEGKQGRLPPANTDCWPACTWGLILQSERTWAGSQGVTGSQASTLRLRFQWLRS